MKNIDKIKPDSDASVLIDIFNVPKNETMIINCDKNIINYYDIVREDLDFNYYAIKKYDDIWAGFFILKKEKWGIISHFSPVIHLNHHDINQNIYIDFSEKKCETKITYNKNKDMITFYGYYLNGKLHNRIGPAYMSFYNNKWNNRFFLYGKIISLDYFCERMERNWK